MIYVSTYTINILSLYYPFYLYDFFASFTFTVSVVFTFPSLYLYIICVYIYKHMVQQVLAV